MLTKMVVVVVVVVDIYRSNCFYKTRIYDSA